MSDPNTVRVDETEVFVTRAFDAPRELVFAFWTTPERLAKWWGPVGYHAPPEDVVIERRVGGRFQLRMVQDATGAEVWVRGEVVEYVEPEALAIHMVVPQPIGLPPIEVRLRVQFHDHGAKTRVTLHQGPFSTTEQRQQTTVGWGESFDKLDALLANSSEPE